MQKPVLLCILDGVGVKRGGKYDAISQAKTPVLDELYSKYPHSKLATHGLAVGLPEGQMGNSEVGHMNIGGGRVVMQTLPRIDKAIESGELKNNKEIQEQIESLRENGGSLHLMGLVSDGGVHSHQEHLIYVAKLYAENGIKVKIHAFTDGRDTAPNSALDFIGYLVKETAALRNIQIASVSGRYYAMDRDKRWDRVEKAYEAIANARAGKFENAVTAVQESYDNKVTDEFIIPVVNNNYSGMKDGDAIFMANFRADRARQMLTALTSSDFKEFPRGRMIKLSSALGMVEYSESLNKALSCVFPNEVVEKTLGEIISKNGMKQLRIAETEKYAHVTFFFNGGEEKVFEGEDRIMVPSPKVATYDLKPEMSAPEVTDKLVEAIESNKYDLIVCNYANGDMVGHSGILEAAIKAMETLDSCIGRLKAAIEKTGGVMLVTADHGNLEEMLDENGLPHTQHTVGDVPLLMFNFNEKAELKDGRLCDIAPTILHIMSIKQPAEMNGVSLIS